MAAIDPLRTSWQSDTVTVMRKPSRYDVEVAVQEGLFCGLLFAGVSIFAPSTNSTWFGEPLPVRLGVTMTVMFSLFGFINPVLRHGYRITGMQGREVTSYRPTPYMAAKMAAKMRRRGVENVRIYNDAGADVTCEAYEARWWS